MQEIHEVDTNILQASAVPAPRESMDVMNPIASIFQTMVQLSKPRDIAEFRQRILKEAQANGDLFFYSWTVSDRGRRRIISGLTIQAALSILRNYRNLALFWANTVIEGNKITLNPVIVDLENGLFFQRPFTMTLQPAPGKFANDFSQSQRWESMQWQVAVSKAARNAILSVIPQHIINEILDTAQNALRFKVEERIKRQGVDKVRKDVLERLAQYGITQDVVLRKLGKRSVAELTPEDITMLTTDIIAIESNTETPDDLFGLEKVETEAEAEAKNLEQQLGQNKQQPESKKKDEKPDESKKADSEKPKETLF